jgi:hypothetical protein
VPWGSIKQPNQTTLRFRLPLKDFCWVNHLVQIYCLKIKQVFPILHAKNIETTPPNMGDAAFSTAKIKIKT